MATKLVSGPRAATLRELASLQAKVELLQADLEDFTPDEPSGSFAVVRFQKYAKSYSFAAIKIADKWYLTQDGTRSSRQGHGPKFWYELLDFIGDRNFDTIEVLS